MNLKLKAFGLFLIAALAMSAVAASGASAKVKHFEAEVGVNESVTLTGEDTPAPNKPHFEIPGVGSTKCNTASYEGTAPRIATEITVTPTYSNCETKELPTHVQLNGCHYVFTIHTGLTNTEGGATHTHGPVHIVCPAGASITLTITAFGSSVCTIHIGAQTPTTPTVDYKNQGAGTTMDIEVTATVKGVTYTYTDLGFLCPNHAEVGHDANFTGQVTVKGYKDTGEPHQHANQQVGITVIETEA